MEDNIIKENDDKDKNENENKIVSNFNIENIQSNQDKELGKSNVNTLNLEDKKTPCIYKEDKDKQKSNKKTIMI